VEYIQRDLQGSSCFSWHIIGSEKNSIRRGFNMDIGVDEPGAYIGAKNDSVKTLAAEIERKSTA